VPAAVPWLVAASLGSLLWAGAEAPRGAPSYSAATILNSAAGVPGLLAPNTIASVYGKNLAYTTAAVAASDISDGLLPTVLPRTGVRVMVGNVPAHLFYVSPTQINFLVPSTLRPGPADLYVELDSHSGPTVRLTLDNSGPGLFLEPDLTPCAVRLDSSLITPGDPIRPGQLAVLFATGLGMTSPPADYGRAAKGAAWITALDDADILLDGARVERENIKYIGLAPYFAGLYQINLKIPEWIAPNPEIRIRVGQKTSPEGIHLPAAP
jgi:uncharacterized protein (TIGR03437 family)